MVTKFNISIETVEKGVIAISDNPFISQLFRAAFAGELPPGSIRLPVTRIRGAVGIVPGIMATFWATSVFAVAVLPLSATISRLRAAAADGFGTVVGAFRAITVAASGKRHT